MVTKDIAPYTNIDRVDLCHASKSIAWELFYIIDKLNDSTYCSIKVELHPNVEEAIFLIK